MYINKLFLFMVVSYSGIIFSSDWCNEFHMMSKGTTEERNAVDAQDIEARQTSTNDDEQSDAVLAASQAAIKEQIMQHTAQTSRLPLEDENQASTTADDEDNSGTPSLFEMPSQVLRRGSDGTMELVKKEVSFVDPIFNRRYHVLGDMRVNQNSSNDDNNQENNTVETDVESQELVNQGQQRAVSLFDKKPNLVEVVVQKDSTVGFTNGEDKQVILVHPDNIALREQAAEHCAVVDDRREREERMIRLNEEAEQRLLFQRAHDGTDTAPIAKRMYDEKYGPLAGPSSAAGVSLTHQQVFAAAQDAYDDTTTRADNSSTASSQETETESGIVTPPLDVRAHKEAYVRAADSDDSDDEQRRLLRSQKVLSRKEESLGAFSESGHPGGRVLDALSRPTPFTCQITRTTVTGGGCAYEEENMPLAQYQEQHPLTIERMIARKEAELTQLKAQLKKDKGVTDQSDSADDRASRAPDSQDAPNLLLLEESENRAKVAFIETENACNALKVKTKEVQDLLQESKGKDATIQSHQIVAHWVALTNRGKYLAAKYGVKLARAYLDTKKQKEIEGLEQKLKENTADFKHQIAALEDLYREQAATKEKDFTSAKAALQLQVSRALANAQDLEQINKGLQGNIETKDATIASLSAENTKLKSTIFTREGEISVLKAGYKDGSLLFEV